MFAKYCCNCGARDGETAKEKAKRQGAFDWQQRMDVRFSVRRAEHDYLCQFCSQRSEYRHFYGEETGEPLAQV